MRSLEDAINYVNTTENDLLKKELSTFVEGLALELLKGKEFKVVEDGLFLEGLNESVRCFEEIELTEETILSIEYDAMCEFIYIDGYVDGVKNVSCFIREVGIKLFDNSVFDLTDQLKYYVTKQIMLDY
tara:strand:+ start:2163 stop:2549 length:387 start_codon:yes stop_codon:yes gene_type:complete